MIQPRVTLAIEATPLTPAELKALAACADGRRWCGLGMREGVLIRSALHSRGLVVWAHDEGYDVSPEGHRWLRRAGR